MASYRPDGLFISFVLLLPTILGSLLNATDQIFSVHGGIIAAFGDFNSDKQTDVFVIAGEHNVELLLGGESQPYFVKSFTIDVPEGRVTSVVPGDYDGDSFMDILVTATPQDNAESQILLVCWGNGLSLGNRSHLAQELKDQPLVFDYDGDMVPDLLVSTRKGLSVCSVKNRTFVCLLPVLEMGLPARIPHSHAFLDVTGDFTADLLLTLQDKYQVWQNQDGTLSKTKELSLPPDLIVVGQSSFADVDGDGRQDHLVPGCLDTACSINVIYLNRQGEDSWTNVSIGPVAGSAELWFWNAGAVESPTGWPLPPTLRLGDYNIDGYPDALVTMQNGTDRTRWLVLLENVPCTEESCKVVGRMFIPRWTSPVPGAIAAAFFDLFEDGILDILLMSDSTGSTHPTLQALQNNLEADAYFVKIIVLSGLCGSKCGSKESFGVNQPGPYVEYTTVNAAGSEQKSSAAQLSQSAHLALQLPYSVLGLGRSANFIDHLVVGIPRPAGETDLRKRAWMSIIPNAQLIVIPYPNDEPQRWSTKLYLTPSRGVLLTAIALLSVCLLLLIIIGALHWHEKKADNKEKRQEAHRFHFDAM
uniref:Integrin alpha FG-GAP repeat containing 1 n=1 Tax=Eptatretus burgeri TaxID=7764 RepID=A0A8C4R1A1_EPTBU